MTSRLLVVAVSVAVSVSDAVSVAALVNGNDIVSVIDTVDDHGLSRNYLALSQPSAMFCGIDCTVRRS